MSYYLRRWRPRHPYVTGPFQKEQIAEAFAEKWLHEEDGEHKVVSSFTDEDGPLIDPYHSVQIEAQPWDPKKLAIHISKAVFDVWMFNAG